MKAMILAAGRGERMRPLTDSCPKPLLQVGAKPLIVWHIEKLAAAGITEIVINTAWLGEQLPQQLGTGEQWGVTLHYSHEGEQALETAGGIANALDLLGDEPFLVVNGDIYTHVDFSEVMQAASDKPMHLVLVDNPTHNPDGDFAFSNGLLQNHGQQKYTFSGIGVYHPHIFADIVSSAQQPAKLAPLIRQLADRGLVSAQLYSGLWCDIGTPERLKQINQRIAEQNYANLG